MRRGYLKEELDYFLKCVAAGTKPTIVSANDSRAVVAAIRAAEHSARLGEAVKLNPSPAGTKAY